MKARRIILPVGMLLYITSFFLPAVVVHIYGGKFVSGAECAYLALGWPLEAFHDFAHGRVPPTGDMSAQFLLFISGLINPVFLITVIVGAIKPKGMTERTLRVALYFIFVAPLYVLYAPGSNLRPTVGYFLWMIAMLVVLFADKLEELIARRLPAISRAGL